MMKAGAVFAGGAGVLGFTSTLVLGGDAGVGFLIGLTWGCAMMPPLVHIVREAIAKEGGE